MPSSEKVAGPPQIAFTVHTSSPSKVPTKAMLGDREIDVDTDGLVVELVSEDGSMSQTLRLIPEDLDAAAALFKVGKKVVATYSRPA